MTFRSHLPRFVFVLAVATPASFAGAAPQAAVQQAADAQRAPYLDTLRDLVNIEAKVALR